jgi:hypothetical protein
MSGNIAALDQSLDPRTDLRSAHRERGGRIAERDHLVEALTRARVELQGILDVQHDRDTAREAAIAGAVAARAEALLEGTASNVAVVPRPASSADDGLSHEIATARMVEERLAARLPRPRLRCAGPKRRCAMRQ